MKFVEVKLPPLPSAAAGDPRVEAPLGNRRGLLVGPGSDAELGQALLVVVEGRSWSSCRA